MKINNRAMSYVHIVAVVLTTVIFSGCATVATNDAKFIERRNHVTYYSSDWRHSGAQPVGGMTTFVSHLEYPPELRRQHVTGTMTVHISMDGTGQILSEIVRPLNPTLDAIVLRAVREQRWQPAVRAGKPVPCAFSFPITFRI